MVAPRIGSPRGLGCLPQAVLQSGTGYGLDGADRRDIVAPLTTPLTEASRSEEALWPTQLPRFVFSRSTAR